jgi:pyruvate kinase
VSAQTLESLNNELHVIRSEMLGVEEQFLAHLDDLPEARRVSARNLLHYLALRRHDVRSLQDQLSAVGLSSLGQAEAQALEDIDTVLGVIGRLAAAAGQGIGGDTGEERRRILSAHTDALFGPSREDRNVRIMVTIPGEAADDPALVRDLVVSGMDCMRVNCAHDDRRTWSAIISHLRRAVEDTGKPCRVLMDLAGPKLRTGSIEPGPAVMRWKPERDVYGHVVKPARIWLTAQEAPAACPGVGAVTLRLRNAWISNLLVGDRIELFDARDARREMTIVGRDNGGIWAESLQTAYVMPGTSLRRCSRPAAGERRTSVLDVPRTEQSILLAIGDTLVLTRGDTAGRPAVRNAQGDVLEPAVIGVTLPSVFDDVKAGDVVWFDDGRIGAVIRTVGAERIELSVTQAAPEGSKLGADKGINLPDTSLTLPALTPKDLDDLPFVVAHADIVGYSFVRTDGDVRQLQSHLSALGRPDMPLILKIETRRAFENLPALLLALMRGHAGAVMIARGDLAVECGYERLAEVQEEILWMAEASHTPVIWATQVLERLAKDGVPSRAEITDAAMGERAECVMLNKGPHILEAVCALDNILRRMQAHQRKKTAMLRHLGIAERFLSR